MSWLIAIGGYPGVGKSTVAQRLSRDLRIPRLGSDQLGRTIRNAHPNVPEPHRLGFAVLFALIEEFVDSNCSVIVDTNMGWEFQWQRLDAIVAKHGVPFLPIILRCPRAVYMQRIADRYRAHPQDEASVEQMLRLSHFERLCEFLDHLDRPDTHDVDATGDRDATYAYVREIASRSVGRDFAGSG